MATGTAGDTARFYNTAQVHYLRKRITFADYATTVTVGVIPAGASVIGGGVHVVTAFNGTTNVLDVGYSGGAADAYATDLALGALGYIVLDELANVSNTQGTASRTVTCSPAQTGTATAGVADVIVTFVVSNDG